MKHAASYSLILFGAATLTACSILPKPVAPPALHDLGPPVMIQTIPAGAARIATVSVVAPSWLAGTDIHYRWMFADPTQLRSYADNRWAAPPAQLIRARLQLALSRTDSGASSEPHYRLRVRLLEFEQIFDTSQSAHISLRAVAGLLNSGNHQAIAQNLFTVKVATSPDVQGAVQGYSQAANQLVAEIAQWAGTSLASASTATLKSTGHHPPKGLSDVTVKLRTAASKSW